MDRFKYIIIFINYIHELDYYRTFNSTIKKQPEQTAALITFIILVLLINTSCIVLIFMNTLYGNMYYKISFIPIEKFKINKYANMHVWSLNSWAYIYTYGREKLLTLKEIKSIQYYNRKIKPTEFYLLPYESFKKEI